MRLLGMVNPLPSAFVRLRSLSCSWQHSRREILRAKSPGPTSTVKVEAAGDGGTTLTGADGPYDDEGFCAKTGPRFQLVFSPAGLMAVPMPIVKRDGCDPVALFPQKQSVFRASLRIYCPCGCFSLPLAALFLGHQRSTQNATLKVLRHEPQRLLVGRDGASNRNGAARTLRAQKQLTRTTRARRHTALSWFAERAGTQNEHHPKSKREKGAAWNTFATTAQPQWFEAGQCDRDLFGFSLAVIFRNRWTYFSSSREDLSVTVVPKAK
jgi:hypothetical protein